MDIDKRGTFDPIPESFWVQLNEKQRETLERATSFGWSLFAVRRHSAPKPTILLKGPESSKVIVLNADGTLDYFPSIKVRKSK